LRSCVYCEVGQDVPDIRIVREHLFQLASNGPHEIVAVLIASTLRLPKLLFEPGDGSQLGLELRAQIHDAQSYDRRSLEERIVVHRRESIRSSVDEPAILVVHLHRTISMEKKSNGTELAERLERITRLTDELERVQGERRTVSEIAARIRQELQGARRAAQPHQRDRAADGGSRSKPPKS
jgi:hypothetical protein